MSSAIKPPGTGIPVGGAPVDGVGAPSDAESVQGSNQEFRTELENASADVQTKSSASSVGTSRTELLRSLAEDVRTGRIQPQEAVDRLVERTLSTDMAAGLSPTARAELERLLRSKLEDDPILATMQRDLARAR